MALSNRIRSLMEEKLEKRLRLEIKALERKLDDNTHIVIRILTFPFRWLSNNLALVTTAAAVATLFLGIQTFDRETSVQREARVYSLVEILQNNAPGFEGSNLDFATAAIGAMRSGYAEEPAYAFLIAFSVAPFAALPGDSANPVRRIASQTVADAIDNIDDYSEFQAIFAKWSDIVAGLGKGTSDEYLNDTRRVVCALDRTFQKFGFTSTAKDATCDFQDPVAR